MASGAVDEYVFIPLVNDVNYEYNEQTLTLSKNRSPINIKILGNKHITKITENKNKENKNKVDINNILVLTGYAIDENSLGLVHTLDPCDYVKGILINGEIKQLAQGLSKQEIIFSKAEVMNKLYFMRKSKVDLQNDIKINLITDLITQPNPVRKTNYRSLKIDNKKKIEGITDLYDIHNDDAINNLVEKLNDIVNYYSI
ncbi:type III-B CRISPR system CMR subunit Cmr7 [Stygiolobus sp. CP850M]|uniref:type III-B CRISPR system CMR subunit Cmr7 n=1 Tax=Stygiolobus sp. CP850M TaxID=3133134 RepID=UPI00307E5C72